MEIVVGRDQQTRKLCIIKDGVTHLYGHEGFVPTYVSRKHISMQLLTDGKWKIVNLNDRNVTYVNGIGVEGMVVSEDDKIELGESRFLFPWDAIKDFENALIDISPLKKIWDDYDEKRIQFQIAERKFNAARSATGIITMLAIACGFIVGHGPVYILFYGIAIALSLCFLYKAWTDVSRIQERRDEYQEEFDSRWVCPKCGRPIQARNYIVLSKLDSCPYCKTKYKK
jgi:hypothetical protein